MNKAVVSVFVINLQCQKLSLNLHNKCWLLGWFAIGVGRTWLIVIRIYDKKQVFIHLFETWIKTIYLFQLMESKIRQKEEKQKRLFVKDIMFIIVAAVPFQIHKFLNCFNFLLILFQQVFFLSLHFLWVCVCVTVLYPKFEFRVAFLRISCTCKEFL